MDLVYSHRKSVFSSGRNVWRLEAASRASILIDADLYYRAFTEALVSARKQVFILGWDTDSRTELPWPDVDVPGVSRDEPLTLGVLLQALVRARPELHVYVLSWDYNFIYVFERESLPSLKFSQIAGPRLKFVFDQEHPTMASHHQKVVVVDDDLAFSGGLDLTQRRWDTSEHKPHDLRRVDPGGHTYGPFHDVQMCVKGDAAKALGDIARERWKIATGEIVDPPLNSSLQFPGGDSPQVNDVEIAISRTLPYGYFRPLTGENSKPVLEVERLFLDAIRSAERYVYIENQYFTSPVIAKAIAARLEEDDGPEFVMVLPRDQTGWIEESTMGLLRSDALRMVEAAKHSERFRAYYPTVGGLGDDYVKVHSKVLIVDDAFVRVGSANLNSRSMGVDTECDLAFEARDPATGQAREDVARVAASLRVSLLCEHLDVSRENFETRFQESEGKLVSTVESFLGGERTLIRMRPTVPEWVRSMAPPKDWIDPSAPRGIRRWVFRKVKQHRKGVGVALILGVTCLLCLSAYLEARGILPEGVRRLSSPGESAKEFWAWTRSWDAVKISAELERLRGNPSTVPLVIFGFVAGSLCFVPVSAMILGVALAFPPAQAVPVAMAGALLAASAFYGIGRYWAWTKSKTLSAPWVRKLALQMEKGGVWAVTAVRLAPIAPFAAVGIVAGGLRISLRNYLLGSFLGFLPGIVALTWVSNSTPSGLGDQKSWMALVWALLALSAFSFLMPRLIGRMKRSS